MIQKQFRQLTVQHYGDHHKQRNGGQSPMSKISLMGNWLHEAGFKPGYTVTVVVSQGILNIAIEKKGA